MSADLTNFKHSLADKVKKDLQERKKNILYLILSFLNENNYLKSAETLISESKIDCSYEVCDNVDLDLILQEYKSYFFAKFQRDAKILRKSDVVEKKKVRNTKPRKPMPKVSENVEKNSTDSDFHFEIISMEESRTKNKAEGSGDNNDTSVSKEIRKLELESFLFDESLTQEYRDFAEIISKEVIPKTQVSFKDCIGLQETIEVLKESVIYPKLYPDLFQNLDESWNGILLFGPPGNGKTHLAKALATESRSTFINLANSTFITKWRGDSEKMLKVLFDLAKHYAPSIIFIDELDLLVSNSCERTVHEASNRFKSELLTQIDGMNSKKDDIFILATSNNPWALDRPLLRRFEKKILVDLPRLDDRMKILTHYFRKNYILMPKDNLILKLFQEKTEGYSYYDLKVLHKEVIMEKIREAIKVGKKNLPKIQFEEILKSLEKIRPSCYEEDIIRHREWFKMFGTT